MSASKHPAFHTRRIARLAVMCLLALVLPLQGMAAVVFGAMGPAHGHRATSAPTVVLQDVRRWKPAVQRPEHVFASLGHFHAGNAMQRHHHARDDASVVAAAADAADTDEAAAVGAVAVLAMLPGPVVWRAPAGETADASRPPWPALTGFVPRLDRPPRQPG